MINFKTIKFILIYSVSLAMLQFYSSCAQTQTPKLNVACSIDFPIDNSEYYINIQAGKYDTIIKSGLKIYDITFYAVKGGHSVIFGKKFNDRNGYNSPRLIIYKDSIKYQKYSYNDIKEKKKIIIDSLIVYNIQIK